MKILTFRVRKNIVVVVEEVHLIQMIKLYTNLREKAAKTASDVELQRENGRQKNVFFCRATTCQSKAENASIPQIGVP